MAVEGGRGVGGEVGGEVSEVGGGVREEDHRRAYAALGAWRSAPVKPRWWRVWFSNWDPRV